MARVKKPVRETPPNVITWTRFKLPPDQEWPIWTSTVTGPDTAREMYTGPLDNVPGVCRPSVGRMVDDPWQAVYMIVWDERKDLDDFLASPASAEFLRNLPEVDSHGVFEHRNPAAVGIEPALGSLTLGDQPFSSSSLSLTSPHPRFLILEKFHWIPHDVKQRVTMTAFLVPGDKDDQDNLCRAAKSLQGVFGDGSLRPQYLTSPHRLFMWRYITLWCYGSAAPADHSGSGDLGRLERTLLGHSPPQNNYSNSQTLICEFLMWEVFEDPKGDEEKVANDEELRLAWEEAAEGMKEKGVITAWKKERWDFRLAPRWYGEDEDEEE